MREVFRPVAVALLTRDVPGLVDVDVLAVLTLPGDPRGGAATGRALEGDVAALRAHLVAAAHAVLDLGRH